MDRRIPGSVALGLSLLYGSAYFLPLLNPTERYYIPSLWAYVFSPTLIVVLVLAPLFAVYGQCHRFVTWMLCTLFVVLALSSILTAADFSLDTFIAPGAATPEDFMTYRRERVIIPIGVTVCAATALWSARNQLPQVLRFLSLLGYSFAVLAIVRITSHPGTDGATKTKQDSRTVSRDIVAPRRVVWIIFDELDYQETLHGFPNLERLRNESASAVEAYSPAKDTQESLPALLMGKPVRASRLDPDGSLWLRAADNDLQRFSEAASVFARLPGGPQSAALLGYLHPYCRIFVSLGECHSYFLGNAGRWYDGLLFFSNNVAGLIRWTPGASAHVPDSLLGFVDPMFRISTAMADTAPALIDRRDAALVFIHYNIPHYPAEYAQRTLGLQAHPDDRAAYRDNLKLVDRTIGEITRQLSATPGQELLLVLSSDHWHRMSSQTAARPIPFFAWHVGEAQPEWIQQPISTLHTADLVVDFLNGKVTTQAEIARWWHDKPVIPTWIPYNQKY